MTIGPTAPGGYARLASNTVATLAGRIASVILALVVSTVLFRQLGPRAYGVWSFCYVLVGYLSLFDLGLGATVERLVAQAHWRHDRQSTERVLNLATTGAVGFAAALHLVLLILLHLVVPADFSGVVWVLPACVFLSLMSTITGSAISGIQDMKRLNLLRTAMNLVSSGMVIGLALAGVRRVEVLLLAHALGLAGATILAWRFLQTHVGRLRLALVWDPALAREFARFAGPVQAATFLPQVADQALRVVLGTRFGASMMGIYDLGSRAGIVLRSFANALLVAMVPFGTREHLAGGQVAIGRLYRVAVKYITLFLLPSTALVLYHSRTLVALWLGGSAGSEAVLFGFRVFLVANALAGLSGPMSMIARSLGVPGAEAVILPVASVVGLVLAAFAQSANNALVVFAMTSVGGAFVLWGWLAFRIALPVRVVPEVIGVGVVAAIAFLAGLAIDTGLARVGAGTAASNPVVRITASVTIPLIMMAGVAWSGLLTPAERRFWRSKRLTDTSDVA